MKGETTNNNFSSIYPLIHCALAYIQYFLDWSAEIKCTLHIVLPKQLINQFSKELTVLIYTVDSGNNKLGFVTNFVY